MYGAIIGDIIGSPYEGKVKMKRKNFTLFTNKSHHTDDSTMTVAVANALLNCDKFDIDDTIKKKLIDSMQYYGKVHPFGYGSGFLKWLTSTNPKPYNSFGNGSAMRVSSVGWLYDYLPDVEHIAKLTAEVSHNHPEGIRGAQVVAGCIFIARTRRDKRHIKQYVESFGYNLDFTCDAIRPYYEFDVSCQGTIPPAINAFLESCSFEDTIRTAVSLGGDCDTLTAIAGSIAEAYYDIPNNMIEECNKRIPKDFIEVITKFRERVNGEK